MTCEKCGHKNKDHKMLLFSSGYEMEKCMYGSINVDTTPGGERIPHRHYGCKCRTKIETQEEVIGEYGIKHGLQLYVEDGVLKAL